MGYDLTPERFFFSRTFLSFYNIAFLLLISYKLYKGRNEKKSLEFSFFSRIEGMKLQAENIFNS